MAFNSEDLYLSRAKFVMKILGVWVPPDNESIFNQTYRYFMFFLQYLFLIFQFIYIVDVWGDLEAVSQASYVLFTQACLCFKITVFHLNIKILKELLKRMNSEVFRPQSITHEQYALRMKYSPFIISYSNAPIALLTAVNPPKSITNQKIFACIMISSQMVCGSWALKPLFDDAGSRKFPFDMWMPITPESSPNYELGYLSQLLIICMSAYMYFGVDSVALSSVIFGCAQIEIIKVKILSIDSVWKKRGVDVAKTRTDNYEKLIECVKQYQAVYSFTRLVEDAYHSYLLFQLIGGVGIISMSVLRMLVVPWQSMQFFSIVIYVVVITSQLFVCCWCGHELTATSEHLYTVLYECVWYEQDLRFKRDLCFAMMRMSRPMYLRAGHYFTLSRQTFVAVLRMSYSYSAVLNQTAK